MNNVNDEELLYLSRQGCSIAYQTLIEFYYQFIRVIVFKMNVQHIRSVDESDLRQSAMISCLKAFEYYRQDRNARLQTFMSHVIQRNIFSTLRKNNRDYKRYYTHSLDDGITSDANISYEDIIADKKGEYQPSTRLHVKETNEQYVQKNCSILEKEVMAYRLIGYSNQDMATLLDIEVKAIYNASYRLQKKLRSLK